jgi:hypothetical protein
MTYQNLQLAFAAGSYADIQDKSDINTSSLNGNFEFSLTRVGLQDQPITVSMVPLENIQSVGTPVTVSSLPSIMSSFSGGISYSLYSNIPAGQRIRFAWKIETADLVYYDTVTKYYTPTVIFSDDMEGSTLSGKWSVSGGWNYTTDFKYAGSKSLAESPGANYTSSTTRTATYAGPTINLNGAQAAWVSFWVRHRAENFRDILNVEVSTNGRTWIPICGTTTVQEPGTLDGSRLAGKPALTGIREIWTRQLFDLSAYRNNSNVRFRFRFTSDSDPTVFAFERDQGFNIDNFRVIKTNTAFSNLIPAGAVTMNGRLMQDETIKLDWDPSDQTNHDFYELEKSTDGVNFRSIGRITGIGPYNYIDRNPAVGNNFYRVKKYTVDGRFTNTSPINVVYRKKDLALSIFPNPVNDALNIEFSKAPKSRITVLVTDITGRTVASQRFDLNGQTSRIRIDASSWIRQQYIVKVIGDQGETLAIQKFIK